MGKAKQVIRSAKFSREFIVRRIHSLAGFCFLLYLCEHLFTNAQAALLFGDDGKYFIQSVNFIHSLPFLPAIELSIIALPALLHTWWGLERIFVSKPNSMNSDGSTPSLGYRENHAYTWQRITAILLIFAICFHVATMRFYYAPVETEIDRTGHYAVVISDDSIANQLNIKLHKEADGKLVAVADTFGAAVLLLVRDTFQSLWYCVGYSLFVAMTVFHACNGLWTLAITWGVALSEAMRAKTRLFCNILMVILLLLGLTSIWGVYLGYYLGHYNGS